MTATKYSDVDLLVIIDKLPKRKIDRYDVISDIFLHFTRKNYTRISTILVMPEELSKKLINPLIYGNYFINPSI